MATVIPHEIELIAAERDPLLFVVDDKKECIEDVARKLANMVRDSGKRAVWIEGHNNAGKTPVAVQLVKSLDWRPVHLDCLQMDSTTSNITYVEQVDSHKLHRAFGSDEQRTDVVIEGACLRDIVGPIIDREEAFVVYVANVSLSQNRLLIWRDASGRDGESVTFNQELNDYHARHKPDRDFDAAVLFQPSQWARADTDCSEFRT